MTPDPYLSSAAMSAGIAVFGYLMRRISFSIRLIRTAAISAVEQVLKRSQIHRTLSRVCGRKSAASMADVGSLGGFVAQLVPAIQHPLSEPAKRCERMSRERRVEDRQILALERLSGDHLRHASAGLR
jgi:hypothetical protein